MTFDSKCIGLVVWGSLGSFGAVVGTDLAPFVFCANVRM